MIVLMVSDDIIVVRIIVGWVVVVSLGLQGCWGGEKSVFGELYKIMIYGNNMIAQKITSNGI